ncbi:MAG TPA: TonB-dependent receptor, partial [Geothrix sp.]|nr:TonB-dependent receptor [Geothrix sp.]
MTRRWTTLTLTALACATVASAQTSSTAGAVRGIVKNKAGQVVANASLSLRNRETGLVRTAATGSQGDYHIGLLPVGSYELTVAAPGMRTLKDTSVQVSLGQNTIANFSLDMAEASAMVEIVASAQSLDTTQVNSITSVDQKLVETIPINGRNFTDLALLTPGATDAQDNRVSMDGARGIQNNLTIDGASFNSSFFGEQRGSTRIPFAFGADTIKELQVISNAYDAQYGNAAGAVINAVSKTGTNTFSGSALYQIRPENTVAKIRPVPYDPRGTVNSEKARTKKFSQYSFNLNVGGPIIKDRLHFFAGVETYKYKEDYTSIFPVSATPGNTAADLTNFLNILGNQLVVGGGGRTFAQENGHGYSNERTNTVFFGRLDWTINPDHRATLRVNSQNWKSVNGTTTGTSTLTTGETNNGLEENRSISWVAELNSTLSSSLFNEARLQFATERRPRTPNSTASSEISVGGFRAGQNEFLPNGLDEFGIQFIDNLTWVKDDWTFKAGVDLQDFTYRNHFYRRQNGQWFFSTYNAAYQWMLGLPATGFGTINYQQGVSGTDGRIDFGGQLQAFYAQAQYAGLLEKRLNLTLGLRHTRETWDDNPRPNAALLGLDKAADSTATDPRFGFSLDLFGNGKSVLRGGYGWFSSPNAALTVSNTMLGNGNGVRNYFVAASGANLAHFQTGGLLSAGQRISADDRLVRVDPATMSSTFSAGTIVAQLWDPDNKMPQARRMSLGYEQEM